MIPARLNISLPKSMAEEIDEMTRRMAMTRSGCIAAAVRAYEAAWPTCNNRQFPARRLMCGRNNGMMELKAHNVGLAETANP